MEKNKKAFLITNFITFIRALGVVTLVPVFKLLGGGATFLLSVGCFATDCIDGFLARKFKCSTFFGSFFDATCDKAFLIINMILLMSITPFAIIPILLEIGIASVQTIKFNQGVNVKPNKIGKAKMCIAAVCISLCYLLIDKNFLNYFGANLATKIASFDHIKLFSTVLAPLVLSEIVTLGSYIKEFLDFKKEDTLEKQQAREEQEKELEEDVVNTNLKDFLFENNYYEKYKDNNNLNVVKTLIRKRIRKK